MTIISTEHTVVHHSNRHVALASMCSKRLLMKPLITLFFPIVQPPDF